MRLFAGGPRTGFVLRTGFLYRAGNRRQNTHDQLWTTPHSYVRKLTELPCGMVHVLLLFARSPMLRLVGLFNILIRNQTSTLEILDHLLEVPPLTNSNPATSVLFEPPGQAFAPIVRRAWNVVWIKTMVQCGLQKR